MILLIDNYDSFVYNLARYCTRLGQPTRVVRNDAVNIDGIRAERPAAIVISPGPCTPREAGISLPVLEQLAGELPILGVCLGHQAIGAAFGARIVRAAEPMHGRASSIVHDGSALFAGIPNPFRAARYHSLVIDPDSLPPVLRATAFTEDGVIMAVQHESLPIAGVQFHPESILTDEGYRLLANFLRMAGLEVAEPIPGYDEEFRQPAAAPAVMPSRPVTF